MLKFSKLRWPSSTPQGPPSHGETRGHTVSRGLGNAGPASQPAGPSGTQPASSLSDMALAINNAGMTPEKVWKFVKFSCAHEVPSSGVWIALNVTDEPQTRDDVMLQAIQNTCREWVWMSFMSFFVSFHTAVCLRVAVVQWKRSDVKVRLSFWETSKPVQS